MSSLPAGSVVDTCITLLTGDEVAVLDFLGDSSKHLEVILSSFEAAASTSAAAMTSGYAC